jgi:CIC family chloride channel protein
MGAVVSATTHAPITAILIVFEMTNDYRIIPAVMLASIISVLLATLIKKESMYTMKLVKRGVNIHEGRDLNILKSIKVGEILDGDYEIIPAAMKFGELKQRMLKSEHEVFLVVNNANELIGTITWKSLREFFYDQEESSFLFIAADLAKTPQIVLKKEDNLDLVMHLFGRSDMDEFPVIESDKSKKLAGSIRRNAVINIYNREIFKKDLTGGAHSIVSSVDKGRAIALTDSVNMMEVEPPSKCIGKSLEQLKIRSKYNIEVILIRNSSDSGEGIKGRPGALATPHYVIKPGDRLLIIGESKDINRFRNGE